MISFPNAKINIGLNITEKRNDGYHNIESCFYPIPWNDILEIIPSKELSFNSYGISIPGDSKNNLCLKAYNLIKEDYDIPPVAIHLHKTIPIGAGLGGGSADASFTLKSLNKLFNLNLSQNQLIGYAKKLGSDCPFFIDNKPVMAYEKGDSFKPSPISLNGKILIAIYPKIHVSTQEAYSGVFPSKQTTPLNQLIQKNIQSWQNNIKNDFEESIFPNHSLLLDIKSNLLNSGALYSSMSGSGSTIYGIFDKLEEIPPSISNSFTYKVMRLN